MTRIEIMITPESRFKVPVSYDVNLYLDNPDGLTYYIAGPMSGYADHNFPAFDAARDLLVNEGHMVISPADMNRSRGMTSKDQGVYKEVLQIDTYAMLQASDVYFLRGWEESKGATYEMVVAQHLEMGMRFEDGAEKACVVKCLQHPDGSITWTQKVTVDNQGRHFHE